MLAYDNLSSLEIAKQTGLSQPTVSRTLKKMSVIKLRAGRTSCFAKVKIGHELSLFQINEQGGVIKIGVLYLQPNQRSVIVNGQQAYEYEGLPFFLYDVLPAGFLGRFILGQLQKQDGKITTHSNNWQAGEILYYLSHYGCDLTGNLVLGKYATEQSLELEPQMVLSQDYDAIAQNLLESDYASSFVGGEQPKFTCFSGSQHFIIKYAPKLGEDNAVAIRHNDLLVCEYLALAVLADAGVSASKAELISSERRYLQLERFDRINHKGRKGLVSLRAIDAEYLGKNQNWPLSADNLLQQGLISQNDRNTIHLLYAFGMLIGNNDMHLGNLSFYFEGLTIQALAPIYDMLPMAYMPKQGELVTPEFKRPILFDIEPETQNIAQELAIRFWRQASLDDRVSEGFKSTIVQACLTELRCS